MSFRGKFNDLFQGISKRSPLIKMALRERLTAMISSDKASDPNVPKQRKKPAQTLKQLYKRLLSLFSARRITGSGSGSDEGASKQARENSENEATGPPSDDPLLDCLMYFVTTHGKSSTRSALLTGIPLVEGVLTPSLYVRAARRADLKSEIIEKSLYEIADCVLPIILLQENNNACVIKEINGPNAVLLYPPSFAEPDRIKLKKLKSTYTGYAIYTTPLADSEKEEKIEEKRHDAWFWDTILLFRKNYLQIGISSLLMNVLALATPMFVMNVYDRVIPNNAIETLWVLATGVLTIIFFDFIIRSMRARTIDAAGKKIDWILASKLMEKVVSIRMESKPSSVGAFANSINSYESIRTFFTSATISAVFDLPFIPIFLFVIAYIGGPIVLVPLCAVPIVVIVAVFLELPMRSSAQQQFNINLQRNSFLFEMLTGLESIKSLGSEGRTQKKWEESTFAAARHSEKVRLYANLVANFTVFTSQAVTIVSVIVGVYLIQDGLLTMGGLIACSILNARVLLPLAQLTNIITNYQQAKLGLNNLNAIMEMPDELLPEGTQIFHDKVTGDVDFDEVIFHYPMQKKPAIKGISISIRAGEKIGIIGRIGSGKTTILKLILGLYHATDGHVKIDGVDISQINPSDLRKEIGYVSQAPALFSGTARDNIAYANPSESNDKILLASKISGADDFISNHPDGYNMQVGERGEFLSSGQQQAIGLARALVTEPKILLLDEPCSNMDSLSERKFISKLKDVIPDRTLFLATHKLSLLAFVEKIIVLDQGSVVVFGGREQVLKALNDGTIKVRV